MKNMYLCSSLVIGRPRREFTSGEEESRRADFERRCHNLTDCPYFLFLIFSCNNLHADGSSVVDVWII